jgi:hypothetical protein
MLLPVALVTTVSDVAVDVEDVAETVAIVATVVTTGGEMLAAKARRVRQRDSTLASVAATVSYSKLWRLNRRMLIYVNAGRGRGAPPS